MVTLGKLIDGDEKRDAVHVAIAPVVCGDSRKLYPGMGIALLAGKEQSVVFSEHPIGIVDPFLPGPVYPGDKFWMMLLPNTITSLRHNWEHPDFKHTPQEDVEEKSEAEQYIAKAADEAGYTYKRFMSFLDDYVDDGEYTHTGNRETYLFNCKWEDVWRHYKTLTGKSPADGYGGSVFTCSC